MISSTMTHQQGLCSMDPHKRKKSTLSSTQSVPPSEEQTNPEGATASVFKATHPPIQQSKYNYDCYNVNIDSPCTILSLMLHRPLPKTLVTVG